MIQPPKLPQVPSFEALPKVVLASHNAAKLAEMRRLFAEAELGMRVVSLTDFPESTPPAETGDTFAENALIKARAASRLTGLPALADDSGIEVDVLNGMPGVRSARWAGPAGDDVANLELLLRQIDDVATDRRRAINAAEKRRTSERRRLIDPTTCERDYNDEETDFMKAMDRYKRENRRPFPTWSEVLEVMRSLGYRRVAEATDLPGNGPRKTAVAPAEALV